MTPELEAARSNRVVVVSVVVAAVAVTLFCLVGIAVMLGWAGARSGAATPMSIASPAQQVAGPGIDLVAGETLVTPAEASAPPATPAPAAPATAPATPAPATPSYAKPAEPKAARPARKPARAEPYPTDPTDEWPRQRVCRTCGRVTAVATFPDLWEVRVRLDDGATFTVRYPSAPELHVGDRVRLANGRLERE